MVLYTPFSDGVSQLTGGIWTILLGTELLNGHEFMKLQHRQLTASKMSWESQKGQITVDENYCLQNVVWICKKKVL